jgi:hypothetical protein
LHCLFSRSKKRTTKFAYFGVLFLRGLDFSHFFTILLTLKLKHTIVYQIITIIDGVNMAELGINPYVELLRVVQGNINHTAATSVSEKAAALTSEYEKQMAELKKQLPGNALKADDVEAKVTALFEAKIAPLKQEIEGYSFRTESIRRKINNNIVNPHKEDPP